MTDLGLGVKPDLHLVRTVTALGLVEDIARVPSAMQAHQVGQAAAVLLAALGRSGRRALRALDKTLMEISRQGLLGAREARVA